MRFSIVIPLFNKEKEIDKTLCAVIAQTFQDFEVIVIDDGSIDNSFRIASTYKNEKINILSKINGGVSSARNFGVELALGDYVVFLDADDTLCKNHLQVLSDMIDDCYEDVLFSTSHVIEEDGNSFNAPSSLPQDFQGKVSQPFQVLGKGLSLINSSTACVRRDALNGDMIFPVGVTRGEDLHLWIRLIAKYGICHSSSRTVIINRDAIDRSAHKSLREIPAYFFEVLSLVESANVSSVDKAGLRLFYSKSALKTAAFYKMRSDWFFLLHITQLSFRYGWYREVLGLLLIAICPNIFFRIAKSFFSRKITR
jgi:glycosyltransferase involved in cell wall biosynthesis